MDEKTLIKILRGLLYSGGAFGYFLLVYNLLFSGFLTAAIFLIFLPTAIIGSFATFTYYERKLLGIALDSNEDEEKINKFKKNLQKIFMLSEHGDEK
jgi:hypothetical protein